MRVAFPFFTRLLVFRRGWRVRLRWTCALLSGGLLVLFITPVFQPGAYYEAFRLVVSPLVVAAGAGTYTAGRLRPCTGFRGACRTRYLVH